MSVLGNAKSKSHRKAHQVEPDGTGRKFIHLTRGDLWRESARGVSRGHSSEEACRKAGGAKGRRTKREQSITEPCLKGRAGVRNEGEQQLRQLPQRFLRDPSLDGAENGGMETRVSRTSGLEMTEDA